MSSTVMTLGVFGAERDASPFQNEQGWSPMNTGSVVLNFANGSNTLQRRIRQRVPSARVVTVGVL